MIKAKTALGAMASVQTGDGLQLREKRNRGLWQIDAWASSDESVRDKLVTSSGMRITGERGAAVAHGEERLLWAGPARYWWITARSNVTPAEFAAGLQSKEGCVIDMGHSRSVISLKGSAAQAVLQSGIAVDLEASVFKPGQIIASGLTHHTPINLHRLDDEHFELYVYRSYAQHTLEWLLEVAKPYGVDWDARG